MAQWHDTLRCTGGLSISGEAPNLLSFSANLVQSQVEEAKVILAQTLLLQFQQAPDNDLKLLYFIFIVEPPPTKGAGGRPQTFKRTTWWRLLSQHTFHCEWQVTYNRKDPNVNSDMYVLVILVILIIKENKKHTMLCIFCSQESTGYKFFWKTFGASIYT